MDDLTVAAEAEWLEKWTEGPSRFTALLGPGSPAPDLDLPDHTGQGFRLSEAWSGGPALVMFWRHFGCSCGVERAQRLAEEVDAYADAGLTLVIVSQGEPQRAAAYREANGITPPILCDPDHRAYDAYGVGHWSVPQVLFDAPEEFWTHSREIGIDFQNGRREKGRPPVDDPWRASAEFVVGDDGVIRLSYTYQYCEDFPDPRVLTTAARLP